MGEDGILIDSAAGVCAKAPTPAHVTAEHGPGRRDGYPAVERRSPRARCLGRPMAGTRRDSRHDDAARGERAHQDHVRDAARGQRGAARRVRARPGVARGRGSGRTTRTSSAATSATGDGTFELRSPIDSRPPRRPVRTGTRQDVRDAIAAARAAQPAWAALGWTERLALLRRAAELISERQMEYARSWPIEVGKNRDRGARRGRGERRPDPLLRDHGRGERPLRAAARRPRRRGHAHALGPAAARRVRGHQPLQLPAGALDAGRRRPRSWPGTRSSSSPRARAR